MEEIIKFADGKFELEVNVSQKEETICLNQRKIANLFQKDRKTITRHIQSILKDLELNEKQVCLKKEHTSADGKTYNVKYYNLDMIISIGYRVNSNKGILFRKWANKVLKEYLLKGYAINENRVTVSNEKYIELRNEVVSINNRLEIVEDKVIKKEYRLDKIFYNGEFYDAYSLIQDIFISSNNKIIIIDKSKLYHLGHSIKDLGKKIFSISESDSRLIGELLSRV